MNLKGWIFMECYSYIGAEILLDRNFENTRFNPFWKRSPGWQNYSFQVNINIDNTFTLQGLTLLSNTKGYK